jgi:hypothetical protein
MLMTALRVFEHLHDLVFARMRAAPPAATPDAAAGWDVRNVMAAEKRQVLSGADPERYLKIQEPLKTAAVQAACELDTAALVCRRQQLRWHCCGVPC